MTRTRRQHHERDPRQHGQPGPGELRNLPVRRLFSRVALEPRPAKEGICRGIFSRQPQPRPVGVCVDVRGDQRLGRQFHGVPVADLHARLGPGAVDRQLHGGAARRHGPAGQARKPARPPIRRGDDSRPHQGSVQVGIGRDDCHVTGAFLHVFLPARPVQGREQNHDHPAAGCGRLPVGRERRRQRDRRCLVDRQCGTRLRTVPAGVRVLSDRVHGVRRLPRGGVDRRDAGHRHGGRSDHPAVPHAEPSGRTDKGHRAVKGNDTARDRNRPHLAWPSATRHDRIAQA